MNSRKHPRTMQEAFGPYAGSHITEITAADYGLGWWGVICVVCFAALVVTVW